MTIDKYRTNIEPIDNEHELLRGSLARMKAILLVSGYDKDQLSRHLGNLASRAKNHFRNEEEYLLAKNCPHWNYEEHRVIHNRLEVELDRILSDPENKNLCNKLENWLLPHLLEDKEILS